MAEAKQLEEELWTTADVAHAYRVHPKNIPGLVKEGRIPKPLEEWGGTEKRWLKSECVAHMRAMRKKEVAEQKS